ncbi:hypothetical protein FJU08_22190 [Martelella alba]|uniref:YbjN domain-containing protein n=1 Tax=Martelella alba TaxID=2590451 RepID=A0A506U3M3_9HYPH|nr:hypothetical protein [Martelella alba]TPW26487.1 hypothetical protein FJU08_22190 [Martelella alba]
MINEITTYLQEHKSSVTLKPMPHSIIYLITSNKMIKYSISISFLDKFTIFNTILFKGYTLEKNIQKAEDYLTMQNLNNIDIQIDDDGDMTIYSDIVIKSFSDFIRYDKLYEKCIENITDADSGFFPVNWN